MNDQAQAQAIQRSRDTNSQAHNTWFNQPQSIKGTSSPNTGENRTQAARRQGIADIK